MKPIIAPSILAADFANLQAQIEMLNQSAAGWIHCDIMDGRFVPNFSFGLPVLEAVHKHARKPLDVHLMIAEPQYYIENFKKAGASNITVHYEACTHLHRVVEQIKAVDCKAGVALNPHTPVALLEDIIQDIDLVCLMSVNPGFGGQKFITHTYPKVAALRELILAKNAQALIEIDGGVNEETAPLLLQHGADVLVAGSFVFQATNPLQTILNLSNLST
ncbi:ribulose-phosphate 3-epimerase [Adhaeribacter pallidiroseus]|uniref:Ribulose-phosphate 3-epimerase n=1 Tax=Adhaeribacter pallidiroseus TaxID=2072847 RepID=A0A369QDS6_9BACT|nr:ribulose-phosphate 3-epimerase [Adhaeribacter pallidiroseus]RDC63073.1 Ribulose-phosphate 3-epimerase [Adhaeribacter pallidiroseus]